MSSLIRSERFLLFALTLWLAAQYFILGKYSVVLMADAGDSTLSGVLSLPHAGAGFPLWSPFPASGTDRLALGYTPPLLALLFKILPIWPAYAVAHIAIIGIAVVGIFMLCRRRLEMTFPASFFSAILFGSTFSFIHLAYFSVATLPLALLALSNLLDDMASPRRWLWAGLAAALFSLPASMTILALFPGIFFFAWYLVFERRIRWQEWAVIALFFIVVYSLRGQDILAMGLNAGISQRIDWAHQHQTIFEAVGSGASYILNALNPAHMMPSSPLMHFDFTTISIYLFIFTVIVSKGRFANQSRLLVLIIACLMLTILAPLVKSLVFDFVPIFQGFSVNKVWSYARLCAYIGAGFALQNGYVWIEANGKRFSGRQKRILMASPFVIILALGFIEKGATSAWNWVSHGSFTLFYGSPVIEGLARHIRASGIRSRVASFQMYDVTANAYGLESVGGKLDLFSGRYRQFWMKMVEPSSEKFPENTFHLKTYNYMELGLTYRVPDKKPVRTISELYHMNMFSLLNVRYFMSRDRLVDPQFREMDFAKPSQPWSALDRQQKIRANIEDNFKGRTHVYVFENTQALPRFFLANKIISFKDRAATLDAIAASSLDGLRSTVFVDEHDLPKGLKAGSVYSSEGEIAIQHYGADKIDVAVKLGGESLLVIANSYSPFWKVFVDSKQAKLFPADVALWGVILPEGAKTVSFRYDPPYRAFDIN